MRLWRFAILALLVCVSCAHKAKKDQAVVLEDPVALPQNPVSVELYVMSLCPYAVEAEKALFPVVAELKDFVDFKIDFVGDYFEESGFETLHGEEELVTNRIQLCAMQANRDAALDLITCMNLDYENSPDNMADCAKELGLDADAILACANGEEGEKLLKESFARSTQKGMEASPMLVIKGETYAGARTSLRLKQTICRAFDGVKPDACENIPPPNKIPLKVLIDERYSDCGELATVGILQLKQMFDGLEVQLVDYSSDAGKELFNQIKDTDQALVPAFLFGPEIKQDPFWTNIADYMVETGDYLILSVDAPYDPTVEICDNQVDDDNDGKIDCEDDHCKETLVCRPKTPGTLELFTMSQCPFGMIAVNSMVEVLEALGPDLQFRIHYLGREISAGGFVALHGPAEAEENMRQICAVKHFAKKYQFMDYLVCRNKNPDSPDWRGCAKKMATAIAKCVKGPEGAALMSNSIKLADAIGVNASPTWLVNNSQVFSALSAQEIKEGFCAANEGWKGCDKTLSDDVGLPTDMGCGLE